MKTHIKNSFSVLILILFNTVTTRAQTHINFSVNKIWDSASHSAFTDIIEFKGRFLLRFQGRSRSYTFERW